MERIYVQRKGEAANISVYHRNSKPYLAISEYRPRMSSIHAPKNSSVYVRQKGEPININFHHRNSKPYHAMSEDQPMKSSNHDAKNSSIPTPKAREQQDKICKYWMSGHCGRGDECWYLHSWYCGDGFTRLAKLEGHKKVVIFSEFRVFAQ